MLPFLIHEDDGAWIFAQGFSQNRSVCESLYFGWCLENTHGQNLLRCPFSKRQIQCTRVVSSGFLCPALNILVNRDLTTFLLGYSTFELKCWFLRNNLQKQQQQQKKLQYFAIQYNQIKSIPLNTFMKGASTCLLLLVSSYKANDPG